MKKLILAASLLALSCTALTHTASAQYVGVSINVGQPGFYGRLDIGDFGPPPVIYAQPVIVQRPVRYVETQPLYLRVPPGHAKNWSKHCREYNACGQRVLFVQDNWYQNTYAPRYRERHGEHGHDDRRDDHRDDRGDHDDRGHGNGHGNGNGHGKGHDKHGD
jgi:hypothetical protein